MAVVVKAMLTASKSITSIKFAQWCLNVLVVWPMLFSLIFADV